MLKFIAREAERQRKHDLTQRILHIFSVCVCLVSGRHLIFVTPHEWFKQAWLPWTQQDTFPGLQVGFMFGG